MTSNNPLNVAVVGAGPAGLFAADELSKNDIEVTLFNRDIKPGGLAEYGIYPDKHQLKNGLRKQFDRIINCPNVHYLGNVLIGETGTFKLTELISMGYDAILSTVGAQGTKWLGLPGEDLSGVYHAKDIVYHYNALPPFSEYKFSIGKKVAIIGVGSVMSDIANYLINEKGVEKVIAIARRGPAEIKFTKKDLLPFAMCMDIDAIDEEISRVSDKMLAIDQDPTESKEIYYSAVEKLDKETCNPNFSIKFLYSLSRIIGDADNNVVGIEVEENILINDNGAVKAKRSGEFNKFDVDTVIFAIGDKVDENFGLPLIKYEFAKNPNPLFPINGDSYETFDPDKNHVIEGIFVAGWARKASTGKVGIARRDGTNGAYAIMNYLKTHQSSSDKDPYKSIIDKCMQKGDKIILKPQLDQIKSVEEKRKLELGTEEFSFKTNKEMLDTITDWKLF